MTQKRPDAPTPEVRVPQPNISFPPPPPPPPPLLVPCTADKKTGRKVLCWGALGRVVHEGKQMPHIHTRMDTRDGSRRALHLHPCWGLPRRLTSRRQAHGHDAAQGVARGGRLAGQAHKAALQHGCSQRRAHVSCSGGEGWLVMQWREAEGHIAGLPNAAAAATHAKHAQAGMCTAVQRACEHRSVHLHEARPCSN